MTERDAVEYIRKEWTNREQPGADHFAAMAALMRTHQLMISELDRLLKGYNLSRTAFLLMATLLISRDHTRPLGQLSKHLLVHPTTVTLVIDQLEARELVVRRPHPSDRRTVLAALTEEGLRVVTKAAGELGAANFGLPGVTDAMAQRLTGVLALVRGKLGDT